MEYRFTKLVLTFFTCFLINSCGYFSNDGTDFQIKIEGKIIAEKQKNGNEVNLVFKESEGIYAGIIDDCSEIYYNSLNKEVIVKTRLSGSTEKYFKIEIINANGEIISNSLRKIVIQKSNYESLINSSEKEYQKKYPIDN